MSNRAEEMTEAAIPVLMEVFGCDRATAWNALYPPNGALGPALAVLNGTEAVADPAVPSREARWTIWVDGEDVYLKALPGFKAVEVVPAAEVERLQGQLKEAREALAAHDRRGMRGESTKRLRAALAVSEGGEDA